MPEYDSGNVRCQVVGLGRLRVKSKHACMRKLAIGGVFLSDLLAKPKAFRRRRKRASARRLKPRNAPLGRLVVATVFSVDGFRSVPGHARRCVGQQSKSLAYSDQVESPLKRGGSKGAPFTTPTASRKNNNRRTQIFIQKAAAS